MRDNVLKYLLVAPAVILLAAIALFPIAYLAALSVHDVTFSNFHEPWTFVGLANFREVLFEMPVVRGDFVRTVEFLVFGVGLEFALGLGMAVLFNRPFFGKNLTATLLLVPIMLTPIVVGMMWKAVLNENHGLVNEAIRAVGIAPPAWLSPEGFAWIEALPGGKAAGRALNLNRVFVSVILADVWQWTPFVFLVFSAGLASLPHEPFEAARVDGASAWQTFRCVTLPLLRPVMGVALLIRTMDALKAYDVIWAIFGDSAVTRTLNIEVFALGVQQSRVSLGAALSALMLAGVTVLCGGFVSRFYGKAGEEAR